MKNMNQYDTNTDIWGYWLFKKSVVAKNHPLWDSTGGRSGWNPGFGAGDDGILYIGLWYKGI